MIRLGLIGCGAWGWRYVPAAKEAGNCEITHVARVGASCPPDAHAYLSPVKRVTRWQDMLDAPVDAFIVATPPGERAEVCREILARSRPLMVEKPLTLTLGSADWIVGKATKLGVPLLVNHQHLFAPAYETLREIVLGWKSFTAASCGEGPGPVRSYSALWDYGPHDIAMAIGLGVRARLVRAHRIGGVYRLSLGDAERFSAVRVSNVSTVKRRVLVVVRMGADGAEENVVYDDLLDAGEKLRHRGVTVEVSPEKPLTRAVRAFAEAVRTGRTDWRFGALGAEVVRVLAEADRKIREDHAVNAS